jgi:cytoskeleton protein RodZ
LTEPLGIGAELAQAREALGLSHHDVAQQIKFMPRQLEALEAERFESLPGPTIARGMVRTYARFLKLDPDPLLARMNGRVEAPDPTPQLSARFSQPVPFSDGGRRSTVLYLALSAAVLAAAGGVMYEWRQERSVAAFVTPAHTPEPARQAASLEAAPAAAPAPAPEPQQRAEAAAKKVEAPVVKKAEAPATKTAEAPAAKKAEAPAAKKAEAPAKKAEAQPAQVAASAPRSAGSNRLQLRFEGEAWLEVTNGAGRLLVSSLQPAGTERVVHCSPPCSLVVGNASSVRMSYNDREVDLQAHARQDVARFTLQ